LKNQAREGADRARKGQAKKTNLVWREGLPFRDRKTTQAIPKRVYNQGPGQLYVERRGRSTTAYREEREKRKTPLFKKLGKR